MELVPMTFTLEKWFWRIGGWKLPFLNFHFRADGREQGGWRTEWSGEETPWYQNWREIFRPFQTGDILLKSRSKKSFTCPHCEKSFSHKHSHILVRNHTCDQCGKCFREKGTLKVHLWEKLHAWSLWEDLHTERRL